jgi:hypothetical protein
MFKELPIDGEDGQCVVFLAGLRQLQQPEADPLLSTVSFHPTQQPARRGPRLPLQPHFRLGNAAGDAEPRR